MKLKVSSKFSAWQFEVHEDMICQSWCGSIWDACTVLSALTRHQHLTSLMFLWLNANPHSHDPNFKSRGNYNNKRKLNLNNMFTKHIWMHGIMSTSLWLHNTVTVNNFLKILTEQWYSYFQEGINCSMPFSPTSNVLKLQNHSSIDLFFGYVFVYDSAGHHVWSQPKH